jgi:transketolase
MQDANKKFYLNNKVMAVVEGGFGGTLGLEQVATRKGFGDGLLLAGKANEKVVALCADLTESTQMENFKKTYPEKFFEIGVAEQNMASVASGLSSIGKIPFIASYATFSPGRNWEQIRTTICYNNQPVKIAGHHAGLSAGPDGGTHQALEDVAIMRALPNMVVVVPCDAVEAKKATFAIANNNLPSYIRLFREKSAIITSEETEFILGKANVVYESNAEIGAVPSLKGRARVGLIACGEMVARSLFCVKELEDLGVEVGILNLHTIKPLDKDGVKSFVEKYKNILTIEEHQVAGGMGSAVLEYLAQENLLQGVKFKIMGVNDRFGQSGNREELLEEYGLNEKHILARAKEILTAKQ